jgi:hypothetical protein
MVEIPVSREPARRRVGLAAYLLVGFAWFVLLFLASRVKTVEPIFLWVMTQGLLLEKIFPVGGWFQWCILVGVYLGAGLLAWFVVERPGRDPSHAWRRALLAWLGIQAIYCVVATALVQLGILYE